MSGRTVIVTGASSGLGLEVARYLCEGGNDVILACRNKEKAERAIEKIKRTNPNALATFMELDLASKESINKFVEEFRQSERKLHVLVNNAGLALAWKDTKIQLTPDNFELTMGTNHLGPFMLTNMLLEDLKKTAAAEENGEARIIMVSSSMHNPETMKRRNNMQPLDLEDVFLYKDGAFNGMQAYKNSKLANIMFAQEMGRKLEGSSVTINSVNPGYIPSTELMRNASGAQKFFARVVLHGVLRFTKATRTVTQGANAIIALATDEKFKGVTGKYFSDGTEATASEEANDEEKQKKLWELSGGYLHMEGWEELEVPAPPPPKEEKKEEEKKEEEEAAAAATAEGEKKEGEEGEEGEEKKEGEEGEKKAEEDGEKKEGEGEEKKAEGEQKADNKTDEEKEGDKTEKVDEQKEEEKKDEEKEKEEEKPAEEIKAEDVKLEEKEKTEETEKPAQPEEVKA